MTKMTIFSALAAATLLATGCVNTVSGTKAPAIWFGRDYVAGQYDRPLDQVYQASIAAIKNQGTLRTEYIPHDTTNTVRALYGMVNDHNVWVRVEAVEPNLSEVTVQARTKGGLSDIDTAHDVEKEIALQLQSPR
jgi:Protein of unknown function (DUF3568)